MNPFRRIRDYFRKPTMIGVPPSARVPVPDDIHEHANDFANRYYEPLEKIIRNRMREAGVTEDRIGMIDTDHDFRLSVFRPDRTVGG